MSSRVLIIEDNPANLELMTYLLQAFGYAVFTAEDGERGLDLAGREHPELIICDIQLPDIDGFEVARRLRAHPELRATPIVAVTALAMLGDRDRVLAAGFTSYVAKPIDPETFVQQMEAFLPNEAHTSARHPSTAAPESEPATAHRGYTILVVDNLPVNLYLAQSIFEPFGYRVLTASAASEGLAMARTNHCDLILSDVCMPNGNGFDFLIEVRSDPQLRNMPFVFLTSTMLTERDKEKGLALGANRFLRRPIEPEVLLAEIEACLAGTEKG